MIVFKSSVTGYLMAQLIGRNKPLYNRASNLRHPFLNRSFNNINNSATMAVSLDHQLNKIALTSSID
ncbi:hypothetical protein N483_05090 [Pseudoalteromonas luteoviolacea NCIMB 1944]|nr:hypothetical protein N483_05090 [Pseudoalteromonas luteoviolacea NCIMB 1944]